MVGEKIKQMEQKENNQVTLEGTKQIELPKLNLTQYVGTPAVVEEVTEHRGQHGYFVKATTGIVASVGKEDDPIELKGSKIFGLQEDEEGQIGWGEETKLGTFLKAHKVAHYNDLVGKEVVITMRRTKDGNEFLTFE